MAKYVTQEQKDESRRLAGEYLERERKRNAGVELPIDTSVDMTKLPLEEERCEMSYKMIPAKKEYECDRCGKKWIRAECDAPKGGELKFVMFPSDITKEVRKTVGGDLCEECAAKAHDMLMEWLGPVYREAVEEFERRFSKEPTE